MSRRRGRAESGRRIASPERGPAVKGRFAPQRLACARSAAARVALLISTVPTSMSCSSRRRALKKPTSRIKGVSTLTLIQIDDGVDRAEHEISRRAVPGAHFDFHGAHADAWPTPGCRASCRNRHSAQITEAGDNSQNSAQPRPKVTSPNTKMNIEATTSGMAMMIEIDDEGDDRGAPGRRRTVPGWPPDHRHAA